MARPVCASCPAPLPARARADAKYCSGRCRVAAHRQRMRRDDPFASLRNEPRWVGWTTIQRRGKQTKMPLTVAGTAASSTNPATWTTHRTAAAAADGRVGLVLVGDGLVCVDIDHCVRDGRLLPWASPLVKAAGDTYIELSPSGTGLHIWGRGVLPKGRVVPVEGGKVECYGSGRYITVTELPLSTSRRFGDLAPLFRAVGV